MSLNTSTGERNLETLLGSLRPVLHDGDFVFCIVRDLSTVDISRVVATFREEEATTVILEKSEADRLKLEYSFVSSWITLSIHSALEAVGLTAAVSKALADEGISCNVMAAYFHDHIFVPVGDAGRAMKALLTLSDSR